MTDPLLLYSSVAHAARGTGVAAHVIDALVRAGKIRRRLVGDLCLISHHDVLAAVAQQKQRRKRRQR
jgi:hypothetical protein